MKTKAQAMTVIPAAGLEDAGPGCYDIIHARSGRRIRIPRSQAQFAPRRVIIPTWLAQRILTTDEMQPECKPCAK